MKVLSLFSGVGGFDLGLEAAGMQTVFQCEWDKHATSILQRHWPHVPRWGDITTLTGKHILAHAPVIDVVAWGSPCQDLSVAGKRAGLEGSRSGLFHEGVRIIKELRKETNNEYPRISIWENVYGALNSNRGADFGVILNEMAEAGSLVQEWRVLDAQYFGVPQRRRRVFLISVFDSATAVRCPDPLLPVSEGVQWHPSTSNQTRQTVTGEVGSSLASGRDIANTISAELYHKSTVVNQDVNNGHLVVRNAILGSDIVGPLNTSDAKMISSQYVNENKVIVEPFTKSKRPQTSTDDETWVANQPNPTLNAFDQGDTRTTTAIVFDDDRRVGPRIFENTVSTLQAFMGTGGNNTPMVAQETQDPVLLTMREGKPGGGKGPLLSTDKSLSLSTSNEQLLFTPTDNPIVFENSYRDAARIAEDGITQTLTSKMGTGGGNTPMVAQPVIGFSHTQGLSAQPSESAWPTLRTEGNGMAVAIPIQDGRDIDKHQNGLGVADEGAPSYTIDQTGAQAVAYGLQGNMIGRQDHNGPQGAGISHPDDPMFSLTSTDRHAVATTMAVRRLTPLECERLMGWPDDWTATKADGTPQSDTHRYKQCGNGIASPVAQWIAQQIINL